MITFVKELLIDIKTALKELNNDFEAFLAQ